MPPWTRIALFSTAVLFFCAYRYRINFHTKQLTVNQVRQEKTLPSFWRSRVKTRYILKWSNSQLAPLDYLGERSTVFTKYRCQYTNCFVTSDRGYFRDVADFDAIVFNGRTLLKSLEIDDLPINRSAKQKYVFANMESSHNYPVTKSYFNDFFNWTWTYKLTSDSKWGYFTIYDMNRNEVGPKLHMEWPELDPIDDATKTLLASKDKAAAWFVSNCHTLSKREEFARSVAAKLYKHKHSLHIYGQCGKLACPRQRSQLCYNLLAKEYYFYFAFENSFSEDYVTEKLVTALDNYAIPVVYGGADYSRFLPPGSYLDARALGPERLAETMALIIDSHRSRNSSLYYDFFRWRNHFTYNITSATSDLCKFCKALSDPDLMSKETVYRNFTEKSNLIGPGLEEETGDSETLFLCTYHTFCMKYLRGFFAVVPFTLHIVIISFLIL